MFAYGDGKVICDWFVHSTLFSFFFFFTDIDVYVYCIKPFIIHSSRVEYL